MFFYNLRRALTTGYFIEEDPATGDLTTVAVPGYVYHPDLGSATHPIGFGLFKAIAIGYELWLTASTAGAATVMAARCSARCSTRRRASRIRSQGQRRATAWRWLTCWGHIVTASTAKPCTTAGSFARCTAGTTNTSNRRRSPRAQTH